MKILVAVLCLSLVVVGALPTPKLVFDDGDGTGRVKQGARRAGTTTAAPAVEPTRCHRPTPTRPEDLVVWETYRQTETTTLQDELLRRMIIVPIRPCEDGMKQDRSGRCRKVF